MKAFGNKTSFVPLERTNNIVFDFKNPFATYGLNYSRKRG